MKKRQAVKTVTVLQRESMQEYSNFFGSRKALFGMLLKLLLLAFISFFILHCPHRDSSTFGRFNFLRLSSLSCSFDIFLLQIGLECHHIVIRLLLGRSSVVPSPLYPAHPSAVHALASSAGRLSHSLVYFS